MCGCYGSCTTCGRSRWLGPPRIFKPNSERREPRLGAQKFKGKVVIPAFGQGGGADLKDADVLISNAELKAIRATPKTLVPAPGTGKVVEFLSGVLVLAAGTNVLTEATANLAVKYQSGAGVQVSQTVEMTGFIDQAAHQVTYALPKLDPITARSACENQPLVLHNLGAGEFAGNAANDATLRVKVAYRVHTFGF
jgi:hypothetical protein